MVHGLVGPCTALPQMELSDRIGLVLNHHAMVDQAQATHDFVRHFRHHRNFMVPDPLRLYVAVATHGRDVGRVVAQPSHLLGGAIRRP